MSTLILQPPRQRADIPLARRHPRAAERRLCAVAVPAGVTSPKRTVKTWWVLMAALAAHGMLLAGLGVMKLQANVAPVVVAEFVLMEMPVQILPADGETDASETGVLDPAAALFKSAPAAAPPASSMKWSPGTRDIKMPDAPAKSNWGEVLGLAVAPSVEMTAGYWHRPAGEGSGSEGVADGEAIAGGGGSDATGTGTGTGTGHGHPSYLRNPRPVYPRVALENGWEGTTLLRVQVLANGTAGTMEVLESSGHEVLDEAALKTVRRWRFVAARQKNVPVASWVEIPIQFELGNKADMNTTVSQSWQLSQYTQSARQPDAMVKR
jgi:TonB family protein